MLISLSQAIEPVGGYTTESVTHGQCDARPTVTFPANGRYQFILLGEERHIVCEQLELEPETSRLQVQCPNRYGTRPQVLELKSFSSIFELELLDFLFWKFYANFYAY